MPRVGSSASAVDAQHDGCLECLAAVEGWLLAAGIPPRRRGVLVEQLHHFLQYLTTTTSDSARTASRDAIDRWLAPARGLSEHDDRVTLLNLLSDHLGIETLRTRHQPGSIRARRLRRRLFWADHQRELCRRTRDYFDAITQDDILAFEAACGPFYRALYAASPARDFSGVFVESDEVIVDRIASLTVPSRPAIVDIGCGRGRLLATLRQRIPDATLTGTSIVEFDDDERSTLEAQRIHPLYCPAHALDLADGSQDIVVCSEVIEHLRHPDQLIGEIHRVLRPGGLFCVTAPSRASSFYGPNPFSYAMIAVGVLVPGILPPFHNLYAPLTPIPVVHYGFDPHDFRRRFRARFPSARVTTTRFVSLKKFGVARLAPTLPIVRLMGGLCVAYGTKDAG